MFDNNWLDHKYLLLISSRFRNFKRKGKDFNFSCPYCLDSQKNSRKARGYVYLQKGKYMFHCHNCGTHKNVFTLLRDQDPVLYNEYIKEKMFESPKVKTDVEEFADKMKKPNFVKFSALKDLKKISQLNSDSYAKQYIESRMIPSEYHYKLFFCEKFKEWTNTIIPGKFEDIKMDESRLIIPFLNKKEELIGFQGRAFGKSDLRYITIMLDEDTPKLYGLDKVNLDENINVVEGPIDSMFIDNCVASAGGSIISNLLFLSKDKDKFTVIYDNEPRNIFTIKKLESAIKNGYNVCIWPENLSGKDPNDMILEGMTKDELRYIISNNTYSGMLATLKLQQWKKV